MSYYGLVPFIFFDLQDTVNWVKGENNFIQPESFVLFPIMLCNISETFMFHM